MRCVLIYLYGKIRETHYIFALLLLWDSRNAQLLLLRLLVHYVNIMDNSVVFPIFNL